MKIRDLFNPWGKEHFFYFLIRNLMPPLRLAIRPTANWLQISDMNFSQTNFVVAFMQGKVTLISPSMTYKPENLPREFTAFYPPPDR